MQKLCFHPKNALQTDVSIFQSHALTSFSLSVSVLIIIVIFFLSWYFSTYFLGIPALFCGTDHINLMMLHMPSSARNKHGSRLILHIWAGSCLLGS